MSSYSRKRELRGGLTFAYFAAVTYQLAQETHPSLLDASKNFLLFLFGPYLEGEVMAQHLYRISCMAKSTKCHLGIPSGEGPARWPSCCPRPFLGSPRPSHVPTCPCSWCCTPEPSSVEEGQVPGERSSLWPLGHHSYRGQLTCHIGFQCFRHQASCHFQVFSRAASGLQSIGHPHALQHFYVIMDFKRVVKIE